MKILFVCTGNSCRSVMAKGYLEKRLDELGKTGIEVISAGIAPVSGMQPTKETIQIMKEEGRDISDHCAKKITELVVRESDLIFVMERRHKEYMLGTYQEAGKKTYLLKEFRKPGNFDISGNPEIKDPIGRDMRFYKEVFSVIKDAVERILKEI